MTAVSRVCKPISVSLSSSSSKAFTVHVDVVCTVNKNPVWIIASHRNPKYLSWDLYSKSRIERLLGAARSAQISRPSSILLFFSRGLGDFFLEKICDEFGAFEVDFCEELEGDWINVLQTPYKDSLFLEIKVDKNSECGSIQESVVDSVGLELQEQEEQTKVNLDDDGFCSLISRIKIWSLKAKPDGDLINFDTTALIALVSGISNGCSEKLLATPEIELRQRFKGNVEFVIAQVRFTFWFYASF